MRRAARTDANQTEIVAALRKIGATVQPLHQVGAGCPDLLIGFRGQNWLFEVKDINKPPSRRQLTADQVDWHGGWKGQIATVETADAAIAIVTGQLHVRGFIS